MIKDSLLEIGGVEIYGIVSILLFFTTFTIALLRTWRLSPAVRQRMESLPLAGDQSPESGKDVPHA